MSITEQIENNQTHAPYITQDIQYWNQLFSFEFDPRTLVWQVMKLGMIDAGKEWFYFQRDCRYDDWGTRLFISDRLAARIQESISKLDEH
jgi:hypothetical protein